MKKSNYIIWDPEETILRMIMTNKNNPEENKKSEESIFDFIMRVGDNAMKKAIKEVEEESKYKQEDKEDI